MKFVESRKGKCFLFTKGVMLDGQLVWGGVLFGGGVGKLETENFPLGCGVGRAHIWIGIGY